MMSAMPSPDPTMYYVLPKQAIANLSGLPQACNPDDQFIVLIFKQFKQRLHAIPIVLTDLPIPLSLTANASGIAVLTATGTQAEICHADPDLVARVRTFLRRQLERYELAARDLGEHDPAAFPFDASLVS